MLNFLGWPYIRAVWEACATTSTKFDHFLGTVHQYMTMCWFYHCQSKIWYQVSDCLNYGIRNQPVELCGRSHGKTIKDETFSFFHFFYRGQNAKVFSRSNWSPVARRSLRLWHLWASSLYWISKHRLTICDQREQNFDREKKMWIRILLLFYNFHLGFVCGIKAQFVTDIGKGCKINCLGRQDIEEIERQLICIHFPSVGKDGKRWKETRCVEKK